VNNKTNRSLPKVINIYRRFSAALQFVFADFEVFVVLRPTSTISVELWNWPRWQGNVSNVNDHEISFLFFFFCKKNPEGKKRSIGEETFSNRVMCLLVSSPRTLYRHRTTREVKGAFLWGDLDQDQDQWSKITRIMVRQRNLVTDSSVPLMHYGTHPAENNVD